jgi:DNA end-binding protein Ku
MATAPVKRETPMVTQPRAYWKGYLKLSLVTAAIALYPASSPLEKTTFHQINRRTGNRLRQQMVDEETGAVVEKEDKTRGYEISKGAYIEITPEEIDAIQAPAKHILDIEKFVPVDEIDRRYFNKAYYIAPDGRSGEEAFVVIRDAMRDKGRMALARIVLTNREHIMAIEPFGKGMLGTTLHYDYEVRDEDPYFRNIPEPKIPGEMVELAAHILDSKAGHFDASQFRDQFEVELRSLVERKAAGGPIRAVEQPEAPTNIINLMDALRQSLRGGEGATKKDAAGKEAPKSKQKHGKQKQRKAHG